MIVTNTANRVAIANGSMRTAKPWWTTHGGFGLQSVLPRGLTEGKMVMAGSIQAGSASATYTWKVDNGDNTIAIGGIQSLAAREYREIGPSELGWLYASAEENLCLDATSSSPLTINLTYVDVPNDLQPLRPAHGVIQFEPATATPPNVADTYIATVTRTNGTDGDGGFHATSVNGTAVAGIDFTAVSSDITIADGANSVGVGYTLIGAVGSPGKAFTIVLSAPYGGIALGGDSTLTVTIGA